MQQTAQLPRVGCGAAILRDGKLLLIRRRKAPEAGCWSLPGGKVDPFETVPAAVRREISEEIGVGLIGEQLLCVVDQIDAERGDHWVAPVYVVRNFTGEPRICEPEKHSDLGWFALESLPCPLATSAEAAAEHLWRPMQDRSVEF
jgi:ADP-ribose pyrophosphatase YjhB (NUDIX family)